MQGCMAGFFAEWASDLRSKRPVLIWSGLTLIVGAAGPFGTYPALPLAYRLLAWAAAMAVVIAFSTGVRALVDGGFGLRSFRVGSVLVAAINALCVPLAANLIIESLPDGLGFTFPGMVELGLFVFFASLGVGACRHSTDGCLFRRKPEAKLIRLPDAAVETQCLPRLVERLPSEVRGPLVSITVRDHYVDVTTRRGQASLLLRLSDAVAETGDGSGVRVHRSHWVAWDAIEGIEHKGAKMVLRLQGGAEVPVSKTYRPTVEERGIAIFQGD